MELNTKLSQISGIGSTLAKRLARLELITIEDLINHYPFRYDDFSKISQISGARIGESVTLSGDVWAIKNSYTKFRKVLTRATLNDSTGTIEIVWFNQPWLTKNIAPGDKIQVSGKVDRFSYKTSLVSPQWEKINPADTLTSQNIHTGRLVPVYPETYGLTSKYFRQKISQIFPLIKTHITDPLPLFLKEGLLPLTEALERIHFPCSFEEVRLAKKRLAFDELFYIQLATQKKRLDWQQKRSVSPLKIDQKQLDQFIKNLPFDLTTAQKKVIAELINDLTKGYPMNRLVQGEVGSGKTVVAAAIIYLIYLNNQRSLLMAPTEILAFQHFDTLSKLLSPYGIKIGIYTGSKKFTTRDTPDVIVGTHALLSKKLELDNVGLVVVDEQQRFGVEQRSLLRSRARLPHFLTMTATPIPRTVALTLYGDLDLSIIAELPPGRKTVKTHFVPHSKRDNAYQFIANHLKQGRQTYVITPLIEESETNLSAKAAKVEFEKLKKGPFEKFKLGLLHGKLKSKDKESVINDFKDHKIDILVSTSVVEVGVDVPNATIMVIEGSERFGLAQLHQLRGRVGRGSEQSYTFLFTEEESPQAIGRVKNLEKIYDGLKLAELDLKIRGSGEIFGLKQSGRWNLKVASFSDLGLIEKTREAAARLLQDNPRLDKYPLLTSKLSDLEVMPD